MKRLFSLLCLVVLAAVLGGCAHPVSLTPNLASVVGSGKSKVDKNVGLVITEQDKQSQVTTPGGGGDKISYYPYRDLETGMYIALSESFVTVSRVTGLTDPKVKESGVQYIFTPRILTTSSSPSLLTWPPTEFNIVLTCKVTDSAGKELAEVGVRGVGRAEFDEFKTDPSLAARRAGEDAVTKLIKVLGETTALR